MNSCQFKDWNEKRVNPESTIIKFETKDSDFFSQVKVFLYSLKTTCKNFVSNPNQNTFQFLYESLFHFRNFLINPNIISEAVDIMRSNNAFQILAELYNNGNNIIACSFPLLSQLSPSISLEVGLLDASIQILHTANSAKEFQDALITFVKLLVFSPNPQAIDACIDVIFQRSLQIPPKYIAYTLYQLVKTGNILPNHDADIFNFILPNIHIRQLIYVLPMWTIQLKRNPYFLNHLIAKSSLVNEVLNETSVPIQIIKFQSQILRILPDDRLLSFSWNFELINKGLTSDQCSFVKATVKCINAFISKSDGFSLLEEKVPDFTTHLFLGLDQNSAENRLLVAKLVIHILQKDPALIGRLFDFEISNTLFSFLEMESREWVVVTLSLIVVILSIDLRRVCDLKELFQDECFIEIPNNYEGDQDILGLCQLISHMIEIYSQ